MLAPGWQSRENAAIDTLRDDYADNDLPPARKPSPLGVVVAILVAVVVMIVGLQLSANFVAARMAWTI